MDTHKINDSGLCDLLKHKMRQDPYTKTNVVSRRKPLHILSIFKCKCQSSKVNKEVRIEFESSFSITAGKELMDKLRTKHTVPQPFGTSACQCISACYLVYLQSKICMKNII